MAKKKKKLNIYLQKKPVVLISPSLRFKLKLNHLKELISNPFQTKLEKEIY